MLFAHPFAVGGEVAEEVGPAELALVGVEVVVAAPAVRADDPVVAFSEHGLRLGGVPAGRDPEQPGLTGERTPEHPALAAGLPAGLVDVHDRRPFDLLLKPGVRRGERIAGALDDRVHRPGRELDPEKLTGELGRVTTRDTVADRKRDDSGLESRPERPPRLDRRLGCRERRALRTAHPV